MRLTDAVIRHLPLPANGNRIAYDDDVKGFGARVTAGGAKSFILKVRSRAQMHHRPLRSLDDNRGSQRSSAAQT